MKFSRKVADGRKLGTAQQVTWYCTAGNLRLQGRKLGSACQEYAWLMLPPYKEPVTSPGKSRVARQVGYVTSVPTLCLFVLNGDKWQEDTSYTGYTGKFYRFNFFDLIIFQTPSPLIQV